MSEVTSIPPETPAGVPVGTSVVGVDLRDLDDRGVLAAVGAARRNADREEAAGAWGPGLALARLAGGRRRPKAGP